MSDLLGLGSLLPASQALAAQTGGRDASAAAPIARSLYEALGVRSLINCRGTFTIIGGSIEPPEVRAVKSVANQLYVQLDELMDATGKRLAELMCAEWGMVSAGCAAAMCTPRPRASLAGTPTCTCASRTLGASQGRGHYRPGTRGTSI